MDTKRATDITVLCHALVLIGLSVSGSLSGIASDICYIIAFLLPTVLGLLSARCCGIKPYTVSINKQDLGILSFIIFPSVLLILVVSVITSELLKFTGAVSHVTVYDTFIENALRHAFIPAVLEEAAFRYLPMTLFSKNRKLECVLVSSISFALIHCSLFQIPYALIAGLIFITINLITDSPLPSLFLHIINNLVSVISIFYKADVSVIIALTVLSAISAVFIFKNKHDYIEHIKRVFAHNSKLKLSYSLLIILIPTITIALINLF